MGTLFLKKKKAGEKKSFFYDLDCNGTIPLSLNTIVISTPLCVCFDWLFPLVSSFLNISFLEKRI